MDAPPSSPESTGAGPVLASARRWAVERLPIWRVFRGYRREVFHADFKAALTVSLVSIPQAIGFALIA